MEIWAVILLVAVAGLPLGFGAGSLGRPRSRAIAFAIVLSFPVIVYTAVMASAPASEGGFFAWWAAGLIMLSVPLSAWVILAFVGFSIGRVMQ
jgi:hypothetical protein